MNMKKRIAAVLLTVVMIVSMMPLTVFADPSGWVKKSNGYWYYYETKFGYATGWKRIDGVWYCFRSNGQMYSDEWLWEDLDGTFVGYHFRSSGAMEHDVWRVYNGEWVYLQSNGATALGWKKINNYWYFFDNKVNPSDDHYACMCKSMWIDDTYYLGADGIMYANKWVVAENSSSRETHWIYFDPRGVRVENGWKKINGKWYFFINYATISGSFAEGGKSYYFDLQNGNMITGWFHKGTSNAWFYARGDGSLCRNCWYKINELFYHFDSNGQCTNPYNPETQCPD